MEILAQVFSGEIWNILKILFFIEPLRMTASDWAEGSHYDAYFGANDCEVDKV